MINEDYPSWHKYVPWHDKKKWTSESLNAMQLINKKGRALPVHDNLEEFQRQQRLMTSENDTNQFGNYETMTLGRIIDQIQRINAIKRESVYDPLASTKAGLPPYVDYLQEKNIIDKKNIKL